VISLDVSNHNTIRKYSGEKVTVPGIVARRTVFDYRELHL
jgi:hypothetical protein